MVGNLDRQRLQMGRRPQSRLRPIPCARTSAPGCASSSTTTGPGLPEEARAEVLKRGRRLDETKPGSGLGLSIVRDLAALYRGTLTLERSPLGGLRAVLELPGDAG